MASPVLPVRNQARQADGRHLCCFSPPLLFFFSYSSKFFFFILLLLTEESTELLQPRGPEALNHPRILKLFDVAGTREALLLVMGRCSSPCWTTAAEEEARADPTRWCPPGRPGVWPPGGGVLRAWSRASCFQTSTSAACDLSSVLPQQRAPSAAGRAPLSSFLPAVFSVSSHRQNRVVSFPLDALLIL